VRAADRGEVLEPAAAELLAADLARRLRRLAARALVAAGPPRAAGEVEAAWAALLDERPALVRVLGHAALDWEAATAELLTRLAADLPELRGRFGAAPGARVARCLAGAGDPHAGGRTVALLELDDGTRVVYKPRDLRLGPRLAAAWALRAVVPDVLERDGYGWEAHVEARPPVGIAQERELARECGAALRLLALLGAADLTASNVAGAGERLALLDAETLLGARPRHGDRPPDDDGDARRVIVSGLLGLRLEGAGPPRQVGGLAAPTLAAALAHPDELLDGFRAAHTQAAADRSSLAQALDAAEGAPMRVLLRPSWVYARLRDESLAQDALNDGLERELVLERLWRVREHVPVDPRLVQGEVEALRRGDLPAFAAWSDRDVLEAPGGVEVQGALAEAPLQRARRRLAELPPEAPEPTLSAIGEALAATARDVRAQALNTILARAAAPHERASERPAADDRDPDIAARLQAWQQAASPEDPNRFTRLLAARGLDPTAAAARMTSATAASTSAATTADADTPAPPDPNDAIAAFLVGAGARAPAGDDAVEALARRLVGAAAPRLLRDPARREALRAAVAWELYGRSRLEARRGAWPVALSPEAADAAAAALAGDVLDVTRLVLAEADAPVRWLALLDGVPALARLLGVLACGWEAALEELLDRVAADAPTLAATFGGTGDAARLETLELRRAGRQRGGRTAARLRLTNGPPLYYKPRDLRLDVALDGLLRALDAALELPLRMPAVLAGDGYGWVEAVEQRGPADPTEAAALAYRLGALARVLSLLGAVDMTRLNVLPFGDDLRIVDAETALGAEPSTGRAPAPEARLALVELHLFSDPRGRAQPGEAMQDLGFLAAPSLVGVAAHPQRIVDGYVDAHRGLAAIRDHVAAPGGPLDAFAGAELRVLLRSSRVYASVAREALSPGAMRDGITRELVLERLWRAWSPRVPVALIDAEVAALRDGDAPLFTADPAGRTLRATADGFAVEALVEPPLQRARRTLAELPPDPDPAELDQLRALTFAAAPERAPIAPPSDGEPDPSRPAASVRARPAARRPAPGERDWASLAAREAGRLAAFVDARPDVVIGLEASPWTGTVRLQPLGPDLLNGRAGLAAVLWDAAALEPATAAPAQRLLDELAGELSEATDALRAGADEPPLPGALWGLGGIVHALARSRDHHAPIAALARALDGGMPACWAAGLGTGRAGLAVPLAGAARAGADVPPSVLRALAASLAKSHPPAAPLTRRAGAPLTPFVPDELGIAFACARLAAAGIAPPAGIDPPTTARATLADPQAGPVARLLAGELASAAPDATPAGDDSVELRLLAVEGLLLAGELDRARHLLAALADRAEACGRWFPDRPAPDRYRLSALWGHAAIVSALLRAAEPSAGGALWRLSAPGQTLRP
jgi:lantibiotic modifying enzyme